jgi:hypothetical protein
MIDLDFVTLVTKSIFVGQTIVGLKSRRMRWTGHVARKGERGMCIDIGGKARRKETTRKTKT